MGKAVPSQLRIALDATASLVRTGLEQAAIGAGFVVVPNGCPSVASLRSEDSGRPHPNIDVDTDGSTVTISLRTQPSPELWDALFRLVNDLLG